MEERLHQLEQRLASAQRQVRLVLALALGVPAVLAAWVAFKPNLLAAQPQAAAKQRTVLKAPFDVVGADGKRLMTIEEKRDGGAQVWFYRPENKVNAIIDCTPVGGSFSLHSPDGRSSVSLDSMHDGGSFYIAAAVPGKEEGPKQGVLLWATATQGAKLNLRDPSAPGHGVKLSLVDKDGGVVFARP